MLYKNPRINKKKHPIHKDNEYNIEMYFNDEGNLCKWVDHNVA